MEILTLSARVKPLERTPSSSPPRMYCYSLLIRGVSKESNKWKDALLIGGVSKESNKWKDALSYPIPFVMIIEAQYKFFLQDCIFGTGLCFFMSISE